jgi:phosphoribosylformylglycinamidine synthase subunit PurL
MAIKLRRGMLYPPILMEEGLALGLDDAEWEKIIERLGRPPNHFECSIFAALWSDRVSFKNSTALIDAADFNYQTLQDLPGSSLKLLTIGDTLLALRISQQNFLCAVEPFYAAQAALDSALQELTAAGATPIAVLPMGRFGHHELLTNQRHFRKLVQGLASFSNKFGIPVLGGDFYFHPSYNKAPLINCAVIGILPGNKVKDEKPIPWQSPILYVGAKTGNEQNISLDQIHNKQPISSIPMGDPLLSGKLLNACAEALASGAAEEVVVVGAGGLGVAAFNLATRIGKPVLIDIDRIPLRTELKEPLSILLSESADRVLLLARPNKHRDLNKILYKWDLNSTRIGEVNDADGIEFFWNHYLVADIPFQFAVRGAVQRTMDVVKFPPMLKRSEKATLGENQKRRARKEQDEWSLIREVNLKAETDQEDRQLICPKNLEDVWLDLLANPNMSSKLAVFSGFDQMVGGRTVSRSGGDSAVLRLHLEKLNENNAQALASTIVSNSLYVKMEPYLGTVQTIAEAMRNLAATGATPLSISCCMNFGDPSRYREVCDLAESIRGLGDASRIWNLPIMSEEVSLENGTEGSPVMPTPVILGLGVIQDVRKRCDISFKTKGDRIFLLGETKNEIGCTEYAHYIHKKVNTLVPDIDFELEKRRCMDIIELVQSGVLASCHDLGKGGISLSLIESCLVRHRPIGAHLKLIQTTVPSEGDAPLRPDSALFSESSARFLVSCSEENVDALITFCDKRSIPVTAEGTVGGKSIIIEGLVDIELPLSTTYKLWIHRLESYLASERLQMSAAAAL